MSDKKDKLNEQLQLLEELVRRAYQLINPVPFSYDLKWLMKQNERNALFEKRPKCFLKIKHMGREIPILPVCNRSGIIDKEMIDLSLKMVDRLAGNDRVDQDALIVTATKLKALKSKYSKEIPKPSDMAGRKAHVTRFINNIANKFRFNK